MKRRGFIQSSGLIVGGISTGFTNIGSGKTQPDEIKCLKKIVKFTRDGLDMGPVEYSWELNQLAESTKIKVDYYIQGGSILELENKFAELLGKESAIFMPTGTLANHIAIRKLAGNRKRVIVQADSHIYRDSGDCAQTLSGINLIPINPGIVGFTLDDLEEIAFAVKDEIENSQGFIALIEYAELALVGTVVTDDCAVFFKGAITAVGDFLLEVLSA